MNVVLRSIWDVDDVPCADWPTALVGLQCRDAVDWGVVRTDAPAGKAARAYVTSNPPLISVFDGALSLMPDAVAEQLMAGEDV